MKKSRMHIILPPSLMKRMLKVVPRGIRSDFCRSAIEMAIDAMEKYGPGFLGLMLAGDIKFSPNSNKEDGQNLTKSDG